MTESSLNQTALAEAIATLGLAIDACEFHGGICGLLCARGPGAVSVWLRESGNVAAETNGDSRASSEPLHEAEAGTWQELSAGSLTFYPLLPDGETSLPERVAALAIWCQGFVAGLGLGGYRLGNAAFDDDSAVGHAQIAEIVDDFVEISRAGLEADELEHADQAGFDFAALVEYVRVGVQLIFEELQGQREGSAPAERQMTH